MPNVSVIGSPPRELFTHLQAADYAYDVNETYANYQASDRKPKEAPAAIIVHGTDAALESSEVLLQLLDTNAILLLFSPSIPLLQALKSATKAIIDLPRLEIADSVPLIVYKFRGIDRFHFVPGFSLKPVNPSSIQTLKDVHQGNDSAPNKPELREINPLQFSVELIGSCTSHASDPETLHQLEVDVLVPPLGTLFWYTETLTLPAPRGNISVFIYTYATNAKPNEPDFPGNNGVVYTVFRCTGMNHFNTNDLIHMSDPGGNMICERQLPDKEERYGDLNIYAIDFSEDLCLFNSFSDKPYKLTISYTDSFILKVVRQRFGSTGASFSKLTLFGDCFDTDYESPFRSLTLWSSKALVLTNFEISVKSHGDRPYSIPLDHTFINK